MTIRVVVAGRGEIPADAANVKATRGEGLGPIGRAEGVAAEAVVLLERK